jgi:hypothetical protein
MPTWLLGETRSWIWCITFRNPPRAFRSRPGKDIDKAARAHALESTTQWQRRSGANSRRAEPFSGLQARSCGKRAVTIVADGLCVQFHSLPCGWVVVNSTGAKRLAELATSPISLRSGTGNARRTRSPRRSGESILLVGDPVLIGTPDASAIAAREAQRPWTSRATARLPGSRREVESIVKIASGWHSDVLLVKPLPKPRSWRPHWGHFASSICDSRAPRRS